MRNLLGFAKIGLLAVALVTTSNSASASSSAIREGQFQNLDRMIEELNLQPYFQKGYRARRAIKIAVFDNGFKGAREQIGGLLPANTQIHGGAIAPEGEEEAHGYYMARILWSLLSLGGTDDRYAPAEFHLYPTFGYSNLEAAVNDAIQRDINIVLYSQTWEYGGNFDGRGFINALITKAAKSGILWINNAGNFGDTTFNSGVATGQDDWVKLPGKNSSVEIRCAENPTGKCLFRSVLSWNSFADRTEIGTDKDLDFVLTDDTLNIIQGSSLTQTKGADAPGTSKYPREIITAELKPGLYFLRVKNRSKNFIKSDRLRITASGDFVKMRGFDKRESLLPPADNANVITVGALDSEKSSVSAALRKPELYVNSLVSLNREENFKGTSNSAAMVAAGAALLFTFDPGMTKAKFLSLTGRSAVGGEGRGLPLSQLEFSATTNQGCFASASADGQPDFVRELLRQGGTLVDTNAGLKVFFPFDPIRLAQGNYRRRDNDMIVMSANGAGIYARSGLWNLPEHMIEMVQTPYGASICGASASIPTWARVFRLPNRR